MTRKTKTEAARDKAGETRQERLKSALKANLARRKRQARARHDVATENADSQVAGDESSGGAKSNNDAGDTGDEVQ